MNTAELGGGQTYPAELVELNQWCLWRVEPGKNGSLTKVPYRPDDRKAASNDPRTWSAFRAVQRVLQERLGDYGGLGFLFSPTDPYCGVDLDVSLDQQGKPYRWADEIIDRFSDTYTAFSVSGHGLHILSRATLPKTGRNFNVPDGPTDENGKRAQIGLFDRTRFFALTGQRFGDAPLVVAEHQSDVDWLLSLMEKRREPARQVSSQTNNVQLNDEEIIDRARQAKNGPKFAGLWDGHWEGSYGSQSEADIALCCLLAFWCGPESSRIDSLFRQSGLCREKWLLREDYRERTIAAALEQTSDFYSQRTRTPRRAGSEGTPKPQDETRLPEIWIGARQLHEMTGEALVALQAANIPPALFARSGRMVAVVHDERNRNIIAEISEAGLRGRLARSGFYYKLNKLNEPVECVPPLDVVRDLLARPPAEWMFPPLDGLIETPFLRPDGTVCTEPGYDRATFLYHAPNPGLRLSQIPADLVLDDAQVALDILESAICDFPFADAPSRANAIASILTPIVRPAIDGPTPLALIDAPQAGTGKTLLAEVGSLIATGRPAESFSAPTDPEEWRKKITTTLCSSSSVVVIDNVLHRLDSDALCMALTAITLSDRQFRTFDKLVLPVRCTWIATGNNIQLGGDMPRRCYWIRLDAKMSRPFQRTGFRHENLRGWVIEHRGELVTAILTIARYWFAQGQPKPKSIKPLGSFESWCYVIGGILEAAGVEGFLGNIETMFEDSDLEAAQWEAFLLALDGIFMGHPFKVTDVVGKLSSRHAQPVTDAANVLRPVLPDFLAEAADRTDGFFQRRLGNSFSTRVGRRFGGSQVHLVRAEEDRNSKVARWMIKR